MTLPGFDGEAGTNQGAQWGETFDVGRGLGYLDVWADLRHRKTQCDRRFTLEVWANDDAPNKIGREIAKRVARQAVQWVKRPPKGSCRASISTPSTAATPPEPSPPPTDPSPITTEDVIEQMNSSQGMVVVGTDALAVPPPEDGLRSYGDLLVSQRGGVADEVWLEDRSLLREFRFHRERQSEKGMPLPPLAVACASEDTRLQNPGDCFATIHKGLEEGYGAVRLTVVYYLNGQLIGPLPFPRVIIPWPTIEHYAKAGEKTQQVDDEEVLEPSTVAPQTSPESDRQSPRLLSKVEPSCTAAARKARIRGTVMLAVTVGKNGIARHTKTVRSLGYGLDEAAITAVEQWRFQPGTEDGEPVELAAQIQLSLHCDGR